MRENHASGEQMESMLCRFQDLVRKRSREDLAQCLRILGMYLALYKSRFGDIPPGDYEHLQGTDVVDDELAKIVALGLKEAYAMLSIVGPPTETGAPAPRPKRSRYLN